MDNTSWVGRSSPDLMRVVDDRGVIVWASDAASRLLGYVPDELVGRRLVDLVHPADQHLLREALAETDSPGDVVRRVHRTRAADGEYRWLETTGTMVDHEGRRHLLLSSRDATTAVAAHQAAAESDLRAEVLVRHVEAAVALLGSDGRVRVASKRFRSVMALRHDARGLSLERCLRRWVSGRQLVPIKQAVLRAQVEGTAMTVVVAAARPAGSRWLVEVDVVDPSAPPGVKEVLLRVQPHAAGRRVHRPSALTPREHEVLQLLADGLDIAGVARRLEVSASTIRGYVKSVLHKLGVHSQAQAVVAGARAGLVHIELPDGDGRASSASFAELVASPRSCV